MNQPSIIPIHEYNDCTIAKLYNRRIIVRPNRNPGMTDCMIIEFRGLFKQLNGPLIRESNLGKGVHVCGMTISKEAAIALHAALGNEIIKSLTKNQP